MITTRFCSKCKETKSVTSFRRERSGAYRGDCKDCRRAYDKERYAKRVGHVGKTRNFVQRGPHGAHKICPNCEKDKPVSEFFFRARKKTRTSWCKVCLRARFAKNYIARKERKAKENALLGKEDGERPIS